MAELDARRTEILGNSAKVIQLKTKTIIARKRFLSMRRASIRVQARWRGQMARKSCNSRKREISAVKIQKNLRRCVARKDFHKIKSSAVVLQAGLRGMVSRNDFGYRRQYRAAVTLQASWRRHRAFSDYQKLKRVSTMYQCRWRGRNACRDFSKRQTTDELEEAKEKQTITLERSLQSYPSKDDETDFMFECEVAQLEIEASSPSSIEPSSPESPDDAGEIESLTAEVKCLKAMLHAERQRADEYETKYVKAQELNEERRRKLEESERRVHKLQDSLNRMIYCMSSQFSELKMILHTASKSSSVSGSGVSVKEVEATSSSSENSLTNSDFTFSIPARPASAGFSSRNQNSFHLAVQDISLGDVSGSESDKQGAFDDYF